MTGNLVWGRQQRLTVSLVDHPLGLLCTQMGHDLFILL
jgi:hypothetical protein